MSYTYNNEIKLAESPNLDAFGRLRTANLTTLMDIKHLYDKLPLIIDEVIGGGATSSFLNSGVTMSTSSNNDFVIRQTIECAPYQSGKSQLFEGSFSDFATQSNVTKRVGYFTSTTVSPYNSGFDGFFLESNGTNGQVSFQIWKGGTNIATATQSSWLTTDYDPNLIDWTKTQLMMVDFQWLGVGRMRFYIVVDGIPKLFYTHVGVNNIATVYMDNPDKPIRYEIRQSGAGSGSFHQICSGVSMEGSINSLYYSAAVNDFTERTLSTSGTTYALIGIRLSGTASYLGVSGVLNSLDVLQVTNDNYLVTLQKSPVLSSNPTWSQLSGTPFEYSFGAGSVSVTTDGFVIGSLMGKGNSISQERLSLDDNAFSFGYKINGSPVEWWICIKCTGNNAKFLSGITIKYYK